jgi:hypothetical protein
LIIIKIIGGIGNQMFQYAYGYAIAKKNNTKLYLDLSEINKINTDVNFTNRKYELDVFNINTLELNPLLIKVLKVLIKVNKKFNLDKLKYLAFKKYNITFPVFTEYVYYGHKYIEHKHLKFTYIEGYFQSQLYFKDFETEIKNLFTLPLKYINQTENYDYNNVAVHVRRGDYVNNFYISKIHGVCSISYYERSFDYFHQINDSITFYIFSDSLTEVKNEFANLSKRYKLVFITSNTSHSAFDLLKMSNFKHNIIANSSYSWWSAWLNNNSKKIIISPSQWVTDNYINSTIKDLVPENWEKI